MIIFIIFCKIQDDSVCFQQLLNCSSCNNRLASIVLFGNIFFLRGFKNNFMYLFYLCVTYYLSNYLMKTYVGKYFTATGAKYSVLVVLMKQINRSF